MVIDLERAIQRFTHVEMYCEDPRHRDGDDEETVVVVETEYDRYSVCECCLARIVNASE